MKNIFSHAAPYIAELKRIEALIQSKQLQGAATALNALVTTAPHDPRVFLLGSQLAQASGNADGALKSARKACELAPLWAVATLHLASVFASRGERQEAMAFAKQAVQQAETQSTVDAELLVQAAGIARDCAHLPEALGWLQGAQTADPSNHSTRYKTGLVLSETGDFEGAIAVFSALEAALPGSLPVVSARRQAALGAGQLSLAIQDGETLLAAEPDNLEHVYYLTIARGETPATQPASVVALLFDALAARYDDTQVVDSQYAVPGIVAKMIAEWHPDHVFDLLDLGCGTGLLGACLGPVQGAVVGVDLSNAMIAQAAQGRGYASFYCVNLADAVRDTPEAHYDVIAALDAFAFVGDLEPVIPHVHRVLSAGGHFVFTCETAQGQEVDYALQRNFRYTHNADYVLRLLTQSKFENIVVEKIILRMDAGLAVHGVLVAAQKAQVTMAKPGKTARRSTKSAKPADPL